MGWYTHPDTMAIAGANAAAEREVGKNADELTTLKAYRKHYELQNRTAGINGLDDYLSELDQQIKWKEEGKSDQEIYVIYAIDFHRRKLKLDDAELIERLKGRYPEDLIRKLL